ncbi:hypothetical protein FDP41_007437 [Naegleria fowleri]|uniref:Uncharacterized protein n=1 Tax=Naegleria fowleri TaxID=5763 RepID=A0A6A5CFB5_NAEFO|nr:uncharacterized protein FDP41_007437 [Naegleria fowleri]KAF0984260.1 hypothetical protein FDP41_007437 [Naegleria fowleri]CAG4718091.1 unnamed protein product [Naegleria fowleri]
MPQEFKQQHPTTTAQQEQEQREHPNPPPRFIHDYTTDLKAIQEHDKQDYFPRSDLQMFPHIPFVSSYNSGLVQNVMFTGGCGDVGDAMSTKQQTQYSSEDLRSVIHELDQRPSYGKKEEEKTDSQNKDEKGEDISMNP